MAGVKLRRGAFTCIGWQVTLCDAIWQVTLRSAMMGFQFMKSYTHLYFFPYIYLFYSFQGVFNLPRYYPTYQRFDNDNNDNDDDADAGGSTWRSGEHQRTIPFYRDQQPADNEPIYAKPNKSQHARAPGLRPNLHNYTFRKLFVTLS